MAAKTKYSKKTYIDWYKMMLLARRFEEKCGHLYVQQKFGGFCHLYIGQEAILAGLMSGIEKDDKVVSAYRCHVQPMALGTDPKRIMAELYGKTTGVVKGKGGSMHMFDKEVGYFGGHGIVGGQIGLGAGIGFAEKYKGTKNVCLCFMGDGATRQGMLHEVFNMSMLWKIPTIFIVENNRYSMGTSVERTTNVHDLSKLGLSYDMPSETVDGMDPEAVTDAFKKWAKHCRAGKGPVLLNVETYRYKGHSMSDPQKYRTKDEVEKMKKEDPIEQVLSIIRKNKFMTEKQIEQVEADVKQEVAECVKFAEDSPLPNAETDLHEDVYTQEDYPFIIE